MFASWRLSLLTVLSFLLTAVCLAPAGPARAADAWSDPYPGVRYLYRTTSEPNRIHAAFIERCAVGVSPHVTRPADRGLRTSTFASRYGVQVAINAGFYNTSNYAPIGLTIGEGERWTDSGDDGTYGFLAFGERNRLELSNPSDIVTSPATWMDNVVAGFPMLVEDGQVVQAACVSHMCERHPRTAVGVDASGDTIILVVVDGRWTGVSRGMTRLELAALMVDLGAHRALNLDGGGSSTMYIAGLGGVVNHPSDGSERVVSNHLGFTAGGSTDYARCCRPEEVAGATGVFADMAWSHWARVAAETLYAEGITNGCSASPLFFCPDCLLPRAQATAFLVRALGLAELRPATPTFSDVPASNPYYGFVEALSAAGYITGCDTSPARFCPDDDLNRASAAVLMTRLLGADGLSVSPPTFSDCAAGAWYTPYVERIADACIVTGCDADAGLFCPDDPTTRAEFASMLVRTLELGSFSNCYDGGCVPSCAGRECGSDDCGGSCGTCGAGETCSAARRCEATTTCTADGYEPDGGTGSATTLAAGASRQHSLCPAGDEDWWRFTLGGTSDVVVETSGPDGDTRMWLYDAGQNEIASDDDGGADTFSRIARDGLAAGTYYVKVDEYGDDDPLPTYFIALAVTPRCTPDCAGRVCGTDGCGGTCGSCAAGETCSASGRCESTSTCTPDAWEPDDSAGAANPISPGATQTRSLCPAGDEDWWRFSLATPGDVVIETAGDDGDTRMWLLDGSLGELAFDDDGGAGTFSKIVFGALPAGTWYVKVDDYGDDDALAAYTLTLTVATACVPQCGGRMCGDDGCGGSCGTCPAGWSCVGGACEMACVPDCDGRACGDDGCGGLCGVCPAGWLCDDDGACVPTCDPDCAGRSCGPDGCGGSCGSCPAGDRCDLGRCVAGCTPSCGGRQCGDDGCGGDCGTCGANAVCVVGICVEDCVPDCVGRTCGGDGCGGLCGGCPPGEACTGGVCVGPCTPECTGRLCGDDGCGGECGACRPGESCDAGECVGCLPDCADRECGDDGCGGSCGACGAGEACVAGACKGDCTPDCTGRECGNDGCGGSCGACFGGDHCVDGVCAGGCVADCVGRECGPDGCGGDCGGCPPGRTCGAEGRCDGSCTPECRGRECGDDGCGGDCGTCDPGWTCGAAGVCVAGCVPSCSGRECGDDGCGGECGHCPPESTCGESGRCASTCAPSCAGRTCGDDGCGGTCGACGRDERCDAASGLCVAACVPACAGRSCGDDGCGGTCGACAAGFTCDSAGACMLPPGGGPEDASPDTGIGQGDSPYRTGDGGGGGGCSAGGTPTSPAATPPLALILLLAALAAIPAHRRRRSR